MHFEKILETIFSQRLLHVRIDIKSGSGLDRQIDDYKQTSVL